MEQQASSSAFGRPGLEALITPLLFPSGPNTVRSGNVVGMTALRQKRERSTDQKTTLSDIDPSRVAFLLVRAEGLDDVGVKLPAASAARARRDLRTLVADATSEALLSTPIDDGEFMALCDVFTTDVMELARRVVDVICRPMVADGNTIQLHANGGIAFHEGSDSAADLIARGDAALGAARSLGRNEICCAL